MTLMSRVSEYFNRAAPYYQRRIKNNFLWNYLKSREMKEVLDLLAPNKGENILDLGSGPGIYAEALIGKGCNITCLDFSLAMCRELSKKGIRNFQGCAESFEFKEKFDKIICLGVLEFTESPQLLIANIRKYLKDEGYAVMLIPGESLFGLFYKFLHMLNGIKIKLFLLKYFLAMLRQNGLEPEIVKSIFGYAYIIKAKAYQG